MAALALVVPATAAADGLPLPSRRARTGSSRRTGATRYLGVGEGAPAPAAAAAAGDPPGPSPLGPAIGLGLFACAVAVWWLGPAARGTSGCELSESEAP